VADTPAIRPARQDELDAIGALWGEMYAHQQASGMMLPLRDDAVEIWKRQVADRLDSAVSVVLVAEDGAQMGPCGFLAAQVKRLPAYLAAVNPKVGFVSEVYVRPAARRRRVGQALVQAAFEWFRRAQVGSIELHVLVKNDAAQTFWRELGFEPELLQMRRLLS
jgi:ribosomal protein S18 acetylase RimI-like enzyme